MLNFVWFNTLGLFLHVLISLLVWVGCCVSCGHGNYGRAISWGLLWLLPAGLSFSISFRWGWGLKYCSSLYWTSLSMNGYFKMTIHKDNSTNTYCLVKMNFIGAALLIWFLLSFGVSILYLIASHITEWTNTCLQFSFPYSSSLLYKVRVWSNSVLLTVSSAFIANFRWWNLIKQAKWMHLELPKL